MYTTIICSTPKGILFHPTPQSVWRVKILIELALFLCLPNLLLQWHPPLRNVNPLTVVLA